MKLFGYHITKRDWKATCRELIQKEERALKEASQYKGAWQAGRDELAKAKSELAKTEAQLEAARMTHDRQLKALHDERDGLRLRIEQLEEQRGVLEGEIADCKEAERSNNAYTKMLEKDNDELRKLSMKLGKDKARLNDELAMVSSSVGMDADSAKEYIAELEKENGEAQHKIAELNEACDKLIDENSEYGAEIDRLRALVDSLQEDELAIRCHTLEDRIKDYEKWLDKYRARRAASQRRRRERIKEAKNK